MIALVLATTVGFAFGFAARSVLGRLAPRPHALPREPLRPDIYETVFDELCGYRRAGL